MSVTLQMIYKFLLLFCVSCKKTDWPNAPEEAKGLYCLSPWLNINITQCMLGLFFRNVKQPQLSLTSGKVAEGP